MTNFFTKMPFLPHAVVPGVGSFVIIDMNISNILVRGIDDAALSVDQKINFMLLPGVMIEAKVSRIIRNQFLLSYSVPDYIKNSIQNYFINNIGSCDVLQYPLQV